MIRFRQPLRAPRVRALALLAAVAAALLAAALLAWAAPAWQAWRAERRYQEAVGLRAGQAQARVEAARVAALRGRVEALESRLRAPAGMAGLLRQTEGLARGLGLSVQGRSVRGEGGFHQIDLSLSGSYAAQRRFILGLDGLPALYQVRSLRLSAADNGVRSELRLLVPEGARP